MNRCQITEEHTGLFIGRKHCFTHGTVWDGGGPCPEENQDTTDRVDLLIQGQHRFRWCLGCGMTAQDCSNVYIYTKCCPDCRHAKIVAKDVEDVKLVVEGDYLCEATDRCTCAAPDWGEQIVHEPHCGLEPVFPIAMVNQALFAHETSGDGVQRPENVDDASWQDGYENGKRVGYQSGWNNGWDSGLDTGLGEKEKP